MTLPAYVVRVIARAILTRINMGQGTPEMLAMAYQETDRDAILNEVYKMYSIKEGLSPLDDN